MEAKAQAKGAEVFLKFSSFMNQLLSMLRATQGKST